jgi:uncharacterized membrane protein (UPF0127 family)
MRTSSIVALLTSVLLVAGCGGGTSNDAPMTVVATPATEAASIAPAPTSASPPATSNEPVASTASTPVEALGVVEFVAAGALPGSLPLEVPPPDEYTIGLSGRYELGERGMLFDYGEPTHEGPFWMKNTHVDLDIAFVARHGDGDRDGRIVTIRQMQAESLDLVYSEAPYQWAIEAPLGWYAARGIEVGAEAHFLFDTPSALASR